MATARHLLVVLLLLILPLVVDGADKVMSDFDKPQSINCTPEVKDKSKAVFLYWTITDTTHLYVNQTAPTMEVLDNGWTLYIPSVAPAHVGMYTCSYLNQTGGGQLDRKYELVIRSPSTFQRYRLNIIIGLVATAVAIVLLGVICLVYNFRYEARHSKGDTKPFVHHEYPGTSSGAHYANEAYLDEDGHGEYPVYKTNNDGVYLSDVTVKNTKL